MNEEHSYILKQHDKDILLFIYRFRFLTAEQIQQLLHHKSHSRIGIWLRVLVEQNYLKIHDDKTKVTQPAFYSLGTKGRKYFKEDYTGQGVHSNLLDRVWQEKNYSKRFKNQCVFVAFLYLSIVSLTKITAATVKFHTKTDLQGMKYFTYPLPHAFFSITEKTGATKRYFVDLFQYPTVSLDLVKRVNAYYGYFKGGNWQKYNKNPFPHVIFITSERSYQRTLEKQIKKNARGKNIIQFYFASWDEIQKQGISKKVLCKVEL